MKTLHLHYPVQSSFSVELQVDDDFDPTKIEELQNLVTRNEMIKEIIVASNDLMEQDDFLDISDKEVHMSYCEWLGYDPFEVFPL